MMLKHRKLRAVRRAIGGGVELEVCWRDDAFGKGPCFSVFHHKREALRFDLFDHGAHWHSYRDPMQPRRYFSRSGESFVHDVTMPAIDRVPSPPWDVRVNAAIVNAAKAFPRIEGEVRRWLEIELAAAWRSDGRI